MTRPVPHPDKLPRLEEPHVAPLNALVRRWRRPGDGAVRAVPWFDPDGGGVAARVLVLMESPGPRTVAAGEAGVSSEDNDDPTSAALRGAREEAGLERAAYVRWNVVPWPTYDADGHRRAPRTADLDDAAPALAVLLEHLPDLRLVVAVGAPALTGTMRLLTRTPPARLPHVLGVPHPSPRNAHDRLDARARLVRALAAGRRS